MSYLLNIHTATETAIVSLCKDDKVLDTKLNYDPKQHSSFLHVAVQNILRNQNVNIEELDAIAVTTGPGSYTGIRVGLAAAKGFCYALKIPLIVNNSLEIMARSASQQIADIDSLYCPMIDARRMEVYAAIYDYRMNQIMQPEALILDDNSFAEMLKPSRIFFSGSGSYKFKKLALSPNFIFIESEILDTVLAKISFEKFKSIRFENVAYAAPNYVKDFHTNYKKKMS